MRAESGGFEPPMPFPAYRIFSLREITRRVTSFNARRRGRESHVVASLLPRNPRFLDVRQRANFFQHGEPLVPRSRAPCYRLTITQCSLEAKTLASNPPPDSNLVHPSFSPHNKTTPCGVILLYCGGGEIRTRGALRHTAFSPYGRSPEG